MTKEQKYDKMFMDIADISAEMSHCSRAKVGCVITKDNRVVVNAWNGTISGADNCCESTCKECNGTGRTSGYEERECERCQGGGLTSKTTVVHAEMNSLLFAARNGIKTEGCTMYVTLSPCIECAKAIKQAGIIRVLYSRQYKSSDGISFLKDNGTEVDYINIIT